MSGVLAGCVAGTGEGGTTALAGVFFEAGVWVMDESLS